jgi:hypothetical protein
MAFLTMLVSGILSILSWFEVSSACARAPIPAARAARLTRAAQRCTTCPRTSAPGSSSSGSSRRCSARRPSSGVQCAAPCDPVAPAHARDRFAGTLAQKLVFVRAYAYFLWAHLLVNLVAAIYVLSMIVRASNTDVVKGCQRLVSAGSQSQCTGLLNIATGVFIGVAAVLLVIELCAPPVSPAAGAPR